MNRFLLATMILSVAAAPTVRAETDIYKSKRAYRGDLFDVKVYDPHSKSYFELQKTRGGGKYLAAQKYAKSQFYLGVRGRLAIILSKETQDFINRTIRPTGEAWIGLRLLCRPRKLVWNNEKPLDRQKDYANWGVEWHYRDKFKPCSGGRAAGRGYNLFAGIGLVRFRGVVRWWAIAPGHGVKNALIQFPTGKP